MEKDHLPPVERFNKDTGEFEIMNPLEDEETMHMVSIFNAEEKIFKRTLEMHKWLDHIKGVAHIEYD